MEILDDNYINIPPDERDRPIYRVMSVDRLLDMFKSKHIILRRPALWNDPFENILLRCTTHRPGMGKIGFGGVMKCFYGQCWTFEKESDAMWRIYTANSLGAKIQTTIRKLLTTIYTTQNVNSDRKCWIGKVDYMMQDEMTRFLHELLSNHENILPLITDRTFLSQALFLLFKREAFEYEKEIRLIFKADDDRGPDDLLFPIDPNNLISEVVFDPRMTHDQFTEYQRQFQDLGYLNQVDRSTLYDLPSINGDCPADK